MVLGSARKASDNPKKEHARRISDSTDCRIHNQHNIEPAIKSICQYTASVKTAATIMAPAISERQIAASKVKIDRESKDRPKKRSKMTPKAVAVSVAYAAPKSPSHSVPKTRSGNVTIALNFEAPSYNADVR